MFPHDVLFIQEQLEHDVRSLGLRLDVGLVFERLSKDEGKFHGSGDDLSELTGLSQIDTILQTLVVGFLRKMYKVRCLDNFSPFLTRKSRSTT